MVRHPPRRQLRGRLDPEPPARAGSHRAAGHDRSGACRAPDRSRGAPTARPRRQGADRVERALARRAGRGRRGHGPGRLGRRGRGDRRLPLRAPPPRGRPLDAVLAGRRRCAAPRLRGGPRRARRRLPLPVRGDRPASLAGRGDHDGRGAARAVLGRGRRRVDHRRGRRGARHATEGPLGRRHPVRQQHGGNRPAAVGGPHRRAPLRRARPADPQTARAARGPAPARVRQPPVGGRTARARHHRGGRHRRAQRPGRGGAAHLPPAHRARLGRAGVGAALGGPRGDGCGGTRLRLPGPRVPRTGEHATGARRGVRRGNARIRVARTHRQVRPRNAGARQRSVRPGRRAPGRGAGPAPRGRARRRGRACPSTPSCDGPPR